MVDRKIKTTAATNTNIHPPADREPLEGSAAVGITKLSEVDELEVNSSLEVVGVASGSVKWLMMLSISTSLLVVSVGRKTRVNVWCLCLVYQVKGSQVSVPMTTTPFLVEVPSTLSMTVTSSLSFPGGSSDANVRTGLKPDGIVL
jgi:hypothetical protein